MWCFSQSSGIMRRDDEVIGTAYSGFGPGRNNPAMEQVKDMGPIPQGLYEIGEPFDTETHGPFVMRLLPIGPTYTFGRSGFLIHGDSLEFPGKASHGCIVAARRVREAVAQSGDNQLTVIA
jgi:Protein of unknown function (DUF2778)